jgi:hypothetical protein
MAGVLINLHHCRFALTKLDALVMIYFASTKIDVEYIMTKASKFNFKLALFIKFCVVFKFHMLENFTTF